MNIPELDNLIKAMQCEGWLKSQCEHCPLNYQKLDDCGDHPFWWCDEDKILENALFYLKIYQHLIQTQKPAKEKPNYDFM